MKLNNKPVSHRYFTIGDSWVHVQFLSNPDFLAQGSVINRFAGSGTQGAGGNLFYEWIRDDSFEYNKINAPSYDGGRKSWLNCFRYRPPEPRSYAAIKNTSWTVYYENEHDHAVGIGPARFQLDTFLSALALAFLKLSSQTSQLFLHAAGIVNQDGCVLFPAESGGGKTTLSQAALQKGLGVLSDDRVVIQSHDGRQHAQPTPFGCISTIKGSFPVKGIMLLQKGADNSIQPISKMECFEALWEEESLHRARYFPRDSTKTLFLGLHALVHAAPCYRFRFRNDFADWDYLTRAMGDKP